MVFTDNILSYLKGELFSNGLEVRIVQKYKDTPRIDCLRELSRDKRIVHLGCLDHLPLIEKKIQTNSWLHGEFNKVCQDCIGVDNNKSGIIEVSKRYNVSNILYANILEDFIPEVSSSGKWDYMIMGEILEHIDDPVAFLRTIREKYDEQIEKLVVTVPNVLTHQAFKHMKRNIELINTDHRYWFTPYTISKVMVEAGFEIEQVQFADRIPLNNFQLILRKIKKMGGVDMSYPFSFFSSIVVTSRFKNCL